MAEPAVAAPRGATTPLGAAAAPVATAPVSAAPDPTRAYAVPPDRVARLARLVVVTPRAPLHETRTPFTGEVVARLPWSSESDVAAAFDTARTAQRTWAQWPVVRRAWVLLRLHDLVLDSQVQLLDLVQTESGKTRLQAFEEVADIALTARHYARAGAAYLAPARTRGGFPFVTRAVTAHHPVGVVGVVTPWNFPLTLPIGDSLPALLAGNAVVLRPDPQTALTALAAVELLRAAGLPEGVLQVVVGDGAIGQAVVDAADYVCYTGSTATGRQVAERAARRLVGVSLELGGKNTLYVRADADLDRAASAAVRSCFASAGQLCLHTERVVLDQSIAEPFLDRFLPRVQGLRLGAELAYGPELGSLLGERQLRRTREHLEDAVARGARVLAGGRHRPDVGPYFHEATVLDGVSPAMACHTEETFGPLASVYRVGSDAEAVALANDTAYGLNAAIFSRDVRAARSLAARIRTGTVSVNEGYGAVWSSIGAPLGGMKESGIGRRHGAEGILRFTEAQTVSSQHAMPLGPAFGVGDEGFARFVTGGLRVLRKVGWR